MDWKYADYNDAYSMNYIFFIQFQHVQYLPTYKHSNVIFRSEVIMALTA